MDLTIVLSIACLISACVNCLLARKLSKINRTIDISKEILKEYNEKMIVVNRYVKKVYAEDDLLKKENKILRSVLDSYGLRVKLLYPGFMYTEVDDEDDKELE